MKTLINSMNAIGSISGDRELDEFINENDLRNTITFADYFMTIERLKYKKISSVVRDSGVKQTYAYEMLNNQNKKKISRDRAIALMIAGGLSVDEIQEGLDIAEISPLCSHRNRDVVILYGINQGRNIKEINSLLKERNLEMFDFDEEKRFDEKKEYIKRKKRYMGK